MMLVAHAGEPRSGPLGREGSEVYFSLPVPPELSLDVFFDFFIPLSAQNLVLRAFLAGNLPKKLSKLGVLDERGM